LRGWLLMNSSSWRRTLKLVCTGCFRRKYADWTWYFHRSLLVSDTMSNCLMGCSLLQDQQFLEQINELQRKVQLVARSIFIVIIVGEQPLIYLWKKEPCAFVLVSSTHAHHVWETKCYINLLLLPLSQNKLLKFF
jgi:hypothetical protein